MKLNQHNFPEVHLTKEIIGSAIEVHKLLGPGFGENVYEEAFAHELSLRGIKFTRQLEIEVPYKEIIAHKYRLDFVVEDKVIVELKAVNKLSPIHEAQVLSYLKASKLEIGLLLNFNEERIKDGIKRIVLSERYRECRTATVEVAKNEERKK